MSVKIEAARRMDMFAMTAVRMIARRQHVLGRKQLEQHLYSFLDGLALDAPSCRLVDWTNGTRGAVSNPGDSLVSTPCHSVPRLWYSCFASFESEGRAQQSAGLFA